MQLTHRFTVPADVETTWATLNDIEGVAGCFPGAQVTSVEGDTFQGSCKVKLGPIALVYNGSGSFTEKDEAAHRMVIAAKGKDKRGNGTAGADVIATLAPDGAGTAVEVVTELAITGKPAQFGRGVIQDVSDKLLGQFVQCLEQRLGAGQEEEPPVADGPAPEQPSPPPPPPPRPQQDEALDLGATVLPVLLRSYGPRIAAALGVLVLLRWLLRRRR